jgi:N-methylhydantoinase A
MRVLLDPRHLSIEDFKERLHQECLQRFKIDLSEHAVRLVNLRTSVIGLVDPMDLKRTIANTETAQNIDAARIGERDVWFDGDWHATPIYQRQQLPLGAIFEGPAILNQPDSTTVIEPGNRVSVDDFGNLIVTVTP